MRRQALVLLSLLFLRPEFGRTQIQAVELNSSDSIFSVEDLDLFQVLQEKMDRKTALEIYKKVWDPRGVTKNWIEISPDSLRIRDPKQGKSPSKQSTPSMGEVKYEFRFSNQPTTSTFPRAEGLKGLRVTLDPANIGGACAKLEGKYFQWKPWAPLIAKGTITWGAAIKTKELLEKEGAIVKITRNEPPQFDCKDGMDPEFNIEEEAAIMVGEQIQTNPLLAKTLQNNPLAASGMIELRKKTLIRNSAYSVYRHYDLYRRAKVANEFKSDLTISIQANAGMSGRRRDNSTYTFYEGNGVMTFIFGNVLPQSMNTERERSSALQRFAEGATQDSLSLARSLSKSVQVGLGIPAVTIDTRGAKRGRAKSWYPVDLDYGVYAWSELTVLREISGPVVLVEGLYFNNEDEYIEFIDTDKQTILEGHLYPDRVVAYAEAIFNGISDFVVGNQ